MLIEKLIEAKQKKIGLRPCHTNRASQLGHSCIRFLTWSRTRWQEATPYDVGLQFIFDEGNLQERQVLRDLEDVGFEIADAQKDFYMESHQISGHIEGTVRGWSLLDGHIETKLEIKSMSPFIWDKIDTIEDLKNPKLPYLFHYIAQAQLYMLLTNTEKIVFLFKNKSTGQLKEIWMDLDYDLCEGLLKKAEAINTHVQENTTPPPIPYNEKICGRCSFYTLCLPEFKANPLQFLEDPELEVQLNRRDELAPNRTEYNSVDKELKGRFHEVEKAVVGDFLVTGEWIYPKGKEKYWKVKIQKLEVDHGTD